MLSPDMTQTLLAAARYLNDNRHSWCLIGGAAASFYPIDQATGDDIDIVISPQAALQIQKDLDLENHADFGTDKFRSEIFLKPSFGPVSVDLLAGFQICSKDAWHSVPLEEVSEVNISGTPIYVPTASALAYIFDLCGRPKDIRRSKALRSLLS